MLKKKAETMFSTLPSEANSPQSNTRCLWLELKMLRNQVLPSYQLPTLSLNPVQCTTKCDIA